MIDISIGEGKKVLFASDNHLGAPTPEDSLKREKIFVDWLNSIKTNAQAVFLLGDVFDFWFEYREVVPKGFVRVLGKLAELTDSGIPIHYFVGNHDMWMKDYFKDELNISVYHEPSEFCIDGKSFFIGHGDGLGPYDKGYKMMKKIFTNPFFKWAFRWLHPDIGMKIGHYLSVKNKLISGKEDVYFLGESKESLFQYCSEVLRVKHFDFFVFGHRHLPLDIEVLNKSRYINLGDWVNNYTYGTFDGTSFVLDTYQADIK